MNGRGEGGRKGRKRTMERGKEERKDEDDGGRE